MKTQKNVTNFVLVDDHGERWQKDDKGQVKKNKNGKQIATVTKNSYTTRKNAERAMEAMSGKK